MTKKYKVISTQGWPFPIDMLRVDQAWPETRVDSAMIATTLAHDRDRTKINTLGAVVTLVSAAEGDPHVDEWRSHGWQVTL